MAKTFLEQMQEELEASTSTPTSTDFASTNRRRELTDENEGTLQEIGEGIVSGVLAVPQGILELGGSAIDLVADTNYAQNVDDMFAGIRAAGGIDPVGTPGEIAEVVTQFVVPGLGVAGAVGRMGALSNVSKTTRAAAQAGAAGVTDAVVSTNGTTTIGDFFGGGPTETTDLIGLEGREAAAARIGNKLKVGFEAAGATALVEPTFKALGLVGGTAARIASKPAIVGTATQKLMEASTALSTRGGEFAEKLLGEENFDAVKSVFRSRGNLPQDVFEVRSLISGRVQAEANIAARTLKDLGKNIDKAYKGVEEVMVNGTSLTRADLNNDLYGYLTGEISEKALPDFIKVQAKAMRDQVDGLSNRILNSDYLSKSDQQDIIDTIKGNIGSYIRRKYRLFEDGKGFMQTAEFKKGKADTIKLFEKNPDIYRQFHDQIIGFDDLSGLSKVDEGVFVGVGKSQKVSRQAAEDLTEKLLAASQAKKGKYAKNVGVNRVVVDKLRTDLFKARNSQPEAIRRMLGEVKDPQEAFISTIEDMAVFSATDDFLGYIANKAGDSGEILTKEAYARLPNELKEQYEVLGPAKKGAADYWGTASGLAVSNNMYKDLTRIVANDTSSMGNLARSSYSAFLRAKGITQFGKTVLSPVTQVRNVTSAALFALAQGNVGRGANVFESFNMVMGNIRKKSTAEQLEEYAKLQRLGVIGNQAQLKEIDRLINEGYGVTRDADEVIAGIRVGKNAGNKFTQSSAAQFLNKKLDVAREYYQGGDDLWKIYNFNFEKNKILSAFGTELEATKALRASKQITETQTLDDYAADIVRNTVPNYERVPAFVKGLRKLPLGNFIAFPAEILRTSANTLKQSLDELASGNARVREIGMRRLTGLMSTTMILPAAIQQTAMGLTGVSQEQLDAARRSAAPWSRNSRLIPTSVDEDGNLTGYVDYSFTNPYDYLQRPIQAIFNAVKDGQDLGKDTGSIATNAVLEAVTEMVKPFGDESMLTERLLDSTYRQGVTGTGARVYRDVDTPGTKAYKSLFHIAEAFNPGGSPITFKAQEKTTQTGGFEFGRFLRGTLPDAMVSDKDAAGNERSAAEELLRAVTGLGEVKVKPDKIAMYSSFDYSSNITGARQIFNTAVKTQGALSDSDATSVYRDANDALLRVQNRMYQTVNDMRALGMRDSEIRRSLKKYKVGDVTNLMRGKFTPMQVSDETRRAVRDNGNRLPMSEIRSIQREYRGIELGGEEEETRTLDAGVSAPVVMPPSLTSSTTQPSPAAVVAPTAGQGVGAQQTASAAPTSNTTIRNNPALLGSNPINVLKNMIIGQRNP